MLRTITLITLIILSFSTAAAQDGYPLPENLQPITTANAAQLQELASIGGDLPGGLAWSPDGELLAAGTSAGVKMYDAHDLTKAPLDVPGGQDVLFSPSGDLMVSGGALWNTQNWQAVMTIGESDTRTFSPGGKLLVTSREENEKKIVAVFSVSDNQTVTLQTDSALAFRGVVFSADESKVAVTLMSRDTLYDPVSAEIQVWDVQTGKRILTATAGYEDAVKVAFVANDSKLVVASESDAPYGGPLSDIRLWGLSTGELLKTFDFVFHPVISPDGAIMTFETTEGVVALLLNSIEGLVIGGNWSSEGTSAIFSPDSKTVATVDYSDNSFGTITLRGIDEDHIDTMPSLSLGDSYSTAKLVFSPDGNTIAATKDGNVDLWDIQTATLKQTLETGADNWNAPDVTFSPDGRTMKVHLFSNNISHIQVWDRAVGKKLGEIPYDSKAILSPDWGQEVVWENSTIHVTNIQSGVDTTVTVIEDYLGSASAAPMRIATGRVMFYGDTSRVFSLTSGQEVFRLEPAGTNAKLTPNGKKIVIFTQFSTDPNAMTISIQDVDRTTQPPVTIELDHYADRVIVSPDNSMLVTATFDGQDFIVRLYDTYDGTLLAEWRTQYQQFDTANFTSDGKYLLLGSHNVDGGSQVAFWDLQQTHATRTDDSNAEMSPFLTFRSHGEVVDILFDRDGHQLAILLDDAQYGDGVSHYYTVDMFNADTVLRKTGDIFEDDLKPLVLHSGYIAQFSPNGQYLVTAEARALPYITDTVRLWNSSIGNELATLNGDGAYTFSPDGALLVTHQDHEITIWDVSALVEREQTPLVVLQNTDTDVRELAFSPDGTLLFAHSTSRVSVWGVPG